MNVEKLEKQKKVKVLEYGPGKVENWEMTFSAPISEYVEPAMASASPKVGQEIHGLGYAVSREDADKIDKIEAVPIMHVVNQVTI